MAPHRHPWDEPFDCHTFQTLKKKKTTHVLYRNNMTDLWRCFCNARAGVKTPGTQGCVELRQRWNHTQGLTESLSLRIGHFVPLSDFDTNHRIGKDL